MELPKQTPHSIATEMVLNAGIGIATYAGVLRLLHDAPLLCSLNLFDLFCCAAAFYNWAMSLKPSPSGSLRILLRVLKSIVARVSAV